MIIQNYTFDKATHRITFSDFDLIDLEKVITITDVTNNILIYQFNKTGFGGDVSSNQLTLDFDTDTDDFSNTDQLQIIYGLNDARDNEQFNKDETKGALAMSLVQEVPDTLAENTLASERIDTNRNKFVKVAQVPIDVEGKFAIKYNENSNNTKQLLLAGVEGKTIHILDLKISTNTEQWVKLVDDDDEDIMPEMYFPAVSILKERYAIISLAAPSGKGVYVQTELGTGKVSVHALGAQIDD